MAMLCEITTEKLSERRIPEKVGAAMGTARKRAVFQLLSESKRITWTTFSLGC